MFKSRVEGANNRRNEGNVGARKRTNIFGRMFLWKSWEVISARGQEWTERRFVMRGSRQVMKRSRSDRLVSTISRRQIRVVNLEWINTCVLHFTNIIQIKDCLVDFILLCYRFACNGSMQWIFENIQKRYLQLPHL